MLLIDDGLKRCTDIATGSSDGNDVSEVLLGGSGVGVRRDVDVGANQYPRQVPTLGDRFEPLRNRSDPPSNNNNKTKSSCKV